MAETTIQGSNLFLVKEHNRRAILQSLLYCGALSRIQLAHQTGLSATTIGNLVDEMIAQRLVSEVNGEAARECDGKNRLGRPRSHLFLEKNARYAVGVHMRVGVFRVGLVNLLGELLTCVEVEFSSQQPARQVVEQMAEAVRRVMTESGVQREQILGVGVGVSGLINYQTGINVLAANFGWRNTPILDWMTDLLNLPVVVDNNVRCMALGEAMFGVGRGVNSLAFVYGRFGVGAGIVVYGKVFRGSGLGAGEIGHTTILPEGGPMCRCGKSGCLEPLVSEPALEMQAQLLARQHPESILATCLREETSLRLVKRLFLALRKGDPWARELVENSARYLGIALANLVNLINPELILLGGLFEEEKDIYLPLAHAAMVKHAFGGLGEQVRLQATSFGWQAGVIGAASLALAKFLYMNPDKV